MALDRAAGLPPFPGLTGPDVWIPGRARTPQARENGMVASSANVSAFYVGGGFTSPAGSAPVL